MTDYIITFFTHFDAICCARNLKSHNLKVVMAPVPRVLSASCGTSVQFCCAENPLGLIGEQFEQLYQICGKEFMLLRDNRT